MHANYIIILYRDDHYEFYVNGVMQSSSETMSEFNFQGLLSPPESDTSPPIFFVGGIDDTVMTSVNGSLPSFTGCMKDLTYGYGYDTYCAMITLHIRGTFNIGNTGL